jgi:trimethylamine--corrinoid protein Co-methyltransferase
MGLSDAKVLDMQAGLESGIGAILAALAGVNMVSGVGMLNFESSFSIEKLIIDNDICGMAKRLLEGVTMRDQPMAIDLIKSYFNKPELLSHSSTLRWYMQEQFMPSIAIDRKIGGKKRLEKDVTASERAGKIRITLLEKADSKPLAEPIKKKLWQIMEMDAKGNNAKLPKHQ